MPSTIALKRQIINLFDTIVQVMLMERININTSIKKLIDTYPNIKEIIYNLGFKNIIEPAMLNTVGRFMNIKKGAKMQKIDLALIKEKFLESGYILEDNDE